MNKQELLIFFQKIRINFDQAKGLIRYSVLGISLMGVFLIWKTMIGCDFSDSQKIKRYEKINQQLTSQLMTVEQNIANQSLVKVETPETENEISYNSTEKILKRINQLIRGIDEFQMQHIRIMQSNDNIDGVNLRIKGAYFPLLSFLKILVKEWEKTYEK